MKAISLLASFAVLLVSGCAGANKGNCDPATIEVGGNCYWERAQACDAASCPLDQCVVHEGHPASVECKKQQ